MSEQSIKNPPGSKSLIDYCPLPHEKLAGNYLRLGNIFVHKNVIDLYISYKRNTWSRDLNADLTLGSCFFWSCEVN